jgi:hypothetical protein
MTNKLPDITVGFEMQTPTKRDEIQTPTKRDEISFMYTNNYVDAATSWLHVVFLQNWLAEHNITYVVTYFSTSSLYMRIDCDEARTLIKLTFTEHDPLVMGW